jgi:hypothetical protein
LHDPGFVLDCCHAAGVEGEYSLGEGFEEGEGEERFWVGGGVGGFSLRRRWWGWKGLWCFLRVYFGGGFLGFFILDRKEDTGDMGKSCRLRLGRFSAWRSGDYGIF